ncbi:MAG: HAD hydrolase-like protein [Pseudobdellovibrionaceae bacterium]
MSKIKCIAFDLDDTLLDTSNLLIPIATEEACAAMVKAGLRTTVRSCIEKRQEFLDRAIHENIFREISSFYNPSDFETNAIAKAGEQAFYGRKIPDYLPISSEAKGILENLKNKYTLFLVTSGELETQKAKVKAMQIEHFFSKIFYVHFRNENKMTAFIKILEITGCLPEQLLSLGNRRSQEVREAKQVGAKTCWLKTGEHKNEPPEIKEDIPDFEISSLGEFIKTCQL